MSSGPSDNPSPSRSPEPSTRHTTAASPTSPASPKQESNTTGPQSSAETPQPTAGTTIFGDLYTPILSRQAITSHSRPTPPLIFITETPSTRGTPEVDSSSRQGRTLVARHTHRGSSSQPPRRSRTPYSRPETLTRAHSQPRSTPTTIPSVTMSSSGSSPGNTSTAGSSSGSNPTYQLPYAPFPYPKPNSGK
jgi:hypothetical protein